MRIKKSELLLELRFCKELMDRLIDYADKNYSDSYGGEKGYVIRQDIIRLRRELNEINHKLDWDYTDKK